MAFPKTFLGIAIGWIKCGEVGSESNGPGFIKYTCHSFCRTRARIGKEDGRLFLYCPKCMIQMNNIEMDNFENL